jgi:hypothetical protein
MADMRRECWLCTHYQVGTGFCTLHPVWIDVTPDHYCGGFKRESVEFRDYDEIVENIARQDQEFIEHKSRGIIEHKSRGK